MVKNNKETDSSNSEDETNILKEAIDKQFFNNSLYTTEKAKISQSEKSKTDISKSKYSLRTSLIQEDKFTNFGVTPTFQSFIAKKLDEILAKTILTKHVKTPEHCVKQQQEKNENSGIKLLNSSKNFVLITEVCTDERKSKKRKKHREIKEDNDEAMSRYREAAIEPEYILSKSDTKAWISKHPEPDFRYKMLKNGTLVEKQ